MKVIQEKLPASQIGLEIEISPEASKQAYEQVIQQFTRSANIPGFRKGKVPRQILLQRIGSLRLKTAALEEILQSSLEKAIQQEKLEVLGNYQLKTPIENLLEIFKPGESFTFSATVDVQPEVNLSQYTGFTVQAEEVKPNLAKVDELLDEYRSKRATLIPVENRPVQLGDVAVVDFSGRLANPPEGADEEASLIPGAQGQDFQLEMQVDRFIPGFIDGIVGMAIAETKEIPARFPDEYAQQDIAGQDAIFTVTIKEIKEKELPTLDDEFAKEISEFETLADLRTHLEKRFQNEAESKTKANKEEAILTELVKYLEVELPETLIRQEVDYLITQTAMQLQQQGLDIKRLLSQELVAQMREGSRGEAIARLQRTMALGEVGKRESLEVEPTAIAQEMQKALQAYGDESIDRERLRTVVTEDLLREKILTWLEEHSTVELVPEGTLKTEEAEEASEADSTDTSEEA